MRIDRLCAVNVRNLADVDIEAAPHLNLIYGPNGGGKTALLEAIYLLARGKSFRTHRIDEVVRWTTSRLQVTAHIHHQDDGNVVAGLERAGGRLRIRYQGEAVPTISTHARRFPVVLLTPDSQQLVLGPPKERRHWLDWAMFHVEPSYLEQWRDYYRALRQRNILLKQARGVSQLAGWEQAMAGPARELDAARRRFLEVLQRELDRLTGAFWDPRPRAALESGWDGSQPLDRVLQANREDDRQQGYTRQGPHRADIRFSQAGVDLGAQFSRGQSKLFVSLLILALARVVEEGGEAPILLLDDVGAELDRDRESGLLAAVRSQECQVFLTRTELPAGWPKTSDDARFHVERGGFTKMVE